MKTFILSVSLAAALLLAPTAGAQGEAPAETETPSITGFDMVLIHGLGSSAEVWHKLSPFLESGFDLFVYEIPGHGSTPTVPNLSIETASDDLARFIDDNAIEAPILVGHGIGGMIAMNYAFRFTQDVRRLVIIDAAPVQLADKAQKIEVAGKLLEDYDRFIAGHFLNLSPVEDVTDMVLDQALRTDRVSLTQLLMSSFDFDLREELAYQVMPILVIGSATMFPHDEDPLVFLDSIGYANAQTIAYKPMPDTGHFVMLEKPVQVAGALISYCFEDERSTKLK